MAGFKCYHCDEKFKRIEDLYEHLEQEHSDRIPKDFSPSRYYYYQKTGKMNGRCVECGKKTRWNESTHKYFRFCDDPKCKEKYSKRFKNRMIKKYGKVHLLNDPEQQKKMLEHRSISGTYEWSDGHKKTYVGSYEKSLLESLDGIFGFDSNDVECPSPHTYEYEYNGEKHFYIPDAFIHSIQTEIEVKDGGDNPNMHHKIQDVDKVKEKLKDEVLLSQNSFNYIKIVNKQNFMILKLLNELNRELMNSKGNKDQERRVFILEDGITQYSKPVEESTINTEVNSIMDIIQENNVQRNIIDRVNDNMEHLTEGVLFSEKDTIYNLDKFVSGEVPILFITGMSGSGKSVLGKRFAKEYDAEYIEMDMMNAKFKKIYGEKFSRKRNLEFYLKIYLEYFKDLVVNKNKRLVVEGVQICSFPLEFLSQFAIYILGTSYTKSTFRAIKRQLEPQQIERYGKRFEILFFMKGNIYYYKTVTDLKKEVKALIKNQTGGDTQDGYKFTY